MRIDQLFVAVFLASLLGFGGLGSLPVLRGQLTAAGVAPDALILQSLAVGNISPGPNGLYLVVIGYFTHGTVGALVAFAAVLLPPMLVLVLERVRSRLVHNRRFHAVLQSLSLMVIALLTVSSGSLAAHATTGWLTGALVAAGTVLLLARVPSLVGVLLAVGLGFFLT
ncbi:MULTISPECIES: chromate transporter [unclassified Amycolatopsis]|uniref:chromate transporter n=1 Tax=unclassified Amycolatopsis TaxID=2618356 RepID=UPI001C69C25A|nr:chromate transporter [Amycolatopsis sp. DSM 110486]QYN20544.1 chromate transporter [Amycolatopsis sp. DSM 110486]